MKKVFNLPTWAALLMSIVIVGLSPGKAVFAQENSKDAGIRIYSSPELSKIAVGLAESYYKFDRSSIIRVYDLNEKPAAQGKMPSDIMTLVSDQYGGSVIPNAGWKMIIGRDPVVAVMSLSNPDIEVIRKSGILEGDLSAIISGNKKNEHFTDLLIQDKVAAENIIATFSGIENSALPGKRFTSAQALLQLFESEPDAIAFVSLSGILTPGKDAIIEGVSLVPIDINNNGSIDSFENIYGNTEAFLRGVWIGKYPRALDHRLFLLSGTAPENESSITFLNYIVINSHDLLAGSNFIGPASAEMQTILARLSVPAPTNDQVIIGQNGVALIMLVCLIILLFLVPAIVVHRKNRRTGGYTDGFNPASKVLSPEKLNNPKGLLFDKSHTWTFMENDGMVKVGVDDFLQHIVGPITGLSLLNPGDRVKKGEKIIILSNKGKKIFIKSPISGIIAESNHAINADPSIINNDPCSNGWIYRIQPFNWQIDNRNMLMAEDYMQWIRVEFTRLKDFLTGLIPKDQEEYRQPVLTDGGEIPDNALDMLGAEVWEEFQNQFIDKSKKLK